jgi:hypothetical protein
VFDHLSVSMAPPVMPSGFQMISAFPSRVGAFAGSVRIAAGGLPGQTLRAAAGLGHGVGISTASNSPQRRSSDRAAQAVKLSVGAPTGETAPADPIPHNRLEARPISGSLDLRLPRPHIRAPARSASVTIASLGRQMQYLLWGGEPFDVLRMTGTEPAH